ncbi:hypothetical protein AGMMS49579_01320 [Spirochaetia bacterium]|nr:hypothetical protein AGMMS49579_01320 [Spirochaetia bacterium]
MVVCIDAKDLYTFQPNNRYKNLNRLSVFTAGDEEQFENHRSIKNGKTPLTNFVIQTDIELWYGYNLNPKSISSTFNYIFNKFKKGVYIKISNNNLETFLPFSKQRFINDWGHLMKYDITKYNSFNDMFKQISESSGYNFNNLRVNKYPNQWFANNCLIRFEFPSKDSDVDYATYIHMFQTLCKERQVPNVEFFLNKRDFPILTKNGTEPYFHIFGLNKKIIGNYNGPWAPILSISGSNNFADIPIPTYEDWVRTISQEDDIVFKPNCKSYKYNFDIPWENRKPIAVFRGGSTGCGTRVDNNQRLNLIMIAASVPDLIDAGITNWNLRPRKVINEQFLQTIDISKFPPLVKKLSPEEQAQYKYIINVDGHVSAFRLPLEMSSGSCILLVDSSHGWKMWFSDMLIPFTHYIPVKQDLSDLIEKIKWCKNNDEKCKEISLNALNFYKTHLTKKPMLDFLQQILINIYVKFGKVCYGEKYTTYNDELVMLKNNLKYSYLYDLPTLNIYNSYGKRKSNGWNKAIELLEKPIMQFKDPFFKNENTSIYKINFLGYEIIAKQSNDNNSLINETFMGIFITNPLYTIIPNFVYHYGYDENNTIFTEFINGSSFLNLMQKKQLKIKNILEILIQCILACQKAFEISMFMHNDLQPWNIMIDIIDTPLTLDYEIYGKQYRLLTKHVAVIIDFGRAIAAYKGTWYGQIEKFDIVFGRDIFMLTISLCSYLLKQKDKETTDMCIYLLSFYNNNVKDEKSALSFAFQYKKYADILKLNNIKDSLNYINHLRPLFKKYKIAFGFVQDKINHYKNIVDKNHPKQIIEWVNNKNKVRSFTNTIKYMYEHTLPQPNTIVEWNMVKNVLLMYILKLKKDSIDIFPKEFYLQKELERSISFLTNMYKKAPVGNEWIINLPNFNNINEINFNTLYEDGCGETDGKIYDDINYFIYKYNVNFSPLLSKHRKMLLDVNTLTKINNN